MLFHWSSKSSEFSNDSVSEKSRSKDGASSSESKFGSYFLTSGVPSIDSISLPIISLSESEHPPLEGALRAFM